MKKNIIALLPSTVFIAAAQNKQQANLKKDKNTTLYFATGKVEQPPKISLIPS